MKLIMGLVGGLMLWAVLVAWAVHTSASNFEAFMVAAVCGAIYAMTLTEPPNKYKE